MRISVVSILLVVSLLWRAEALPRMPSIGSLRDAISGIDEMVDADQLELPGPTQYKNAKPLIGILSQACHYCPGK